MSSDSQRSRSSIAVIGAGVVLLILVGLFATTFPFFRVYRASTGSMEKTIPLGSRVLVRTFHLSGSLQDGDIVVFRMPLEHGVVSIKATRWDAGRPDQNGLASFCTGMEDLL